MIRIGFGMMDISAGFGTDLSFKANIKGIRSAIGVDVTKEEKTGIIAPGRVNRSVGIHVFSWLKLGPTAGATGRFR
jgi:hypothetical protein